MRVIIVDDERLAGRQFEMECEAISWVEVAGVFSGAEQALEYMRNHTLEAAFLDIEMPGMNGIMLAKKMREIQPDLVVIFLTGYEQYTLDALKIKADYYLMKPYNDEELLEVMERARLLSKRQKKRVYIRTFGRFDLFIDGKVVQWSNAKAKELLALCVDHRGGIVTLEEAVDKLWEERVYDDRVKNLYRKAVMTLRQVFKKYNVEPIFNSTRGSCNINDQLVDCDYFEWLEKEGAKPSKVGYYMPEYPWAEETSAWLEEETGLRV